LADQANLISSCKIFASRAEQSEIGARYVRSEQNETSKEQKNLQSKSRSGNEAVFA
jgi:hypothetical protein